MATNKIQSSGEILYGRDVVHLLHNFYQSSDGDRVMIVPSLNFDTPGLFKHCLSPRINIHDEDSYDMSNLKMSYDSFRIITDAYNADWKIIADFDIKSNIFIRSYKKIQMNLFAHLKDMSFFCIETP